MSADSAKAAAFVTALAKRIASDVATAFLGKDALEAAFKEAVAALPQGALSKGLKAQHAAHLASLLKQVEALRPKTAQTHLLSKGAWADAAATIEERGDEAAWKNLSAAFPFVPSSQEPFTLLADLKSPLTVPSAQSLFHSILLQTASPRTLVATHVVVLDLALKHLLPLCEDAAADDKPALAALLWKVLSAVHAASTLRREGKTASSTRDAAAEKKRHLAPAVPERSLSEREEGLERVRVLDRIAAVVSALVELEAAVFPRIHDARALAAHALAFLEHDNEKALDVLLQVNTSNKDESSRQYMLTFFTSLLLGKQSTFTPTLFLKNALAVLRALELEGSKGKEEEEVVSEMKQQALALVPPSGFADWLSDIDAGFSEKVCGKKTDAQITKRLLGLSQEEQQLAIELLVAATEAEQEAEETSLDVQKGEEGGAGDVSDEPAPLFFMDVGGDEDLQAVLQEEPAEEAPKERKTKHKDDEDAPKNKTPRKKSKRV